MALKLFEDDDGDSSQNEDISKIEIDEDYARRLEYNRKRQDLQRYEELKNKGVIDEDSDDSDESESEESESDGDFGGDSKSDFKFFDSLLKVKKQDPSLKNKDVKLFESESDGEDGGSEKDDNDRKGKEDKKKKMYLKDVQAKHLMEEGPEFDEKDTDGGAKGKKKIKTYAEEQEELRKAVLDAVEAAEAEADEDDDLLRVKENSREDLEEDEELVRKVDEYFGGDAELDENKKFLKEYFTKQLWKDKDEKGKSAVIDTAELDELDEDEDELERQEEYETNYRYEENPGDRIMGHSRKVEESVRKKENARKVQRKSKEERMRIAELERQEELKHLKNVKKKEIKERMKKVLTIAGLKEGEECPFSAKDLDNEFDPEEYDRMMSAVFDEQYYDAEDSDFGSDEDDEKPDFDKEDELLGLPKNWDVIKPGDGFVTAREESLKRNADGVGNEDLDGQEEEEDGSDEEGEEEKEEEELEETEESKRKRKRKASLVQRAKAALMEEYYKLDYEDTIGDLKTRFKYAKVKPNRYGLSSDEMLGLEDKELNQYVSLKKIAPYRENEWKVPNSKRHQQKLKNKELLREKREHHKNDKKQHKKRPRDDEKKKKKKKPTSNDQRSGKKRENADAADESALVTDCKPEAEDETYKLSRKAKRRRRQSELKVSHSRMVAYGKV